MIYIFLALWLATGAATFFARSRRAVHLLCALHMGIHALFAARLLFGGAFLATSSWRHSYSCTRKNICATTA